MVQISLPTDYVSFQNNAHATTATIFADGGAVTAVINGPSEAEPGDLIILDASRSSNATTFKWLLVNSKKTFLPVDQNERCVFSSGTPQEYIFVLIAAGGDNNGKLDVAVAEHRVVVGSPIDPVNPTPPVPGKTTRVIVVMDSDNDTIEENQSLLNLRSNPNLSPKLLIIGRDQAPQRYLDLIPNPTDESFPAYFNEDAKGNITKQGHISELTK